MDTERRLATRPPVAVPTIILHGGDDSFGAPSAEISSSERVTFPRLVDKRIVAGAGHFVPHEKPEPVAKAIIDVIQKS
jgi:pimeloyl-ACP methyl ester carboxylesterase